MGIRNSFRKRYRGSFWVFLIMITVIYLINHPRYFRKITSFLNIEEKTQETDNERVSKFKSIYPEVIQPNPSMDGEWIYKPNFILYYDECIMQARFTVHKLEDSYTRGIASRKGIRFAEEEFPDLETADYSDYSGSGYDRGHLVPAGDFKCCQAFLEETFSMSNISPFNTELNRYAWNELEIKTRNWARKNKMVYVITGSVFGNRFEYIGRRNDIGVPTHFYKIIFTLSNNETPKKVIAFLLPNKPLSHFSVEESMITIDKLEDLTEIDFFPNLPDELENKLEAANQTGTW